MITTWILAAILRSGTAIAPPDAPDRPDSTTTASLAVAPDVVVDATIDDLDLEIEGWSQARVEIESGLGDGFVARLEQDGGRVHIRFTGPGVPRNGSLRMRLPTSADLQIRARKGDVDARQINGRITVTSVSGDVQIHGTPTRVEVASTSGDVELRGAVGRVEIATISGDVDARRLRGEVAIETVSGDIELRETEVDCLQVSGVSGDVAFGGRLGKGPHQICSHSGDVAIAVPPSAPLRIEVTTFSGAIVDELVKPPRLRSGEYSRELGSGGGALEISTFSGDVHLAAVE